MKCIHSVARYDSVNNMRWGEQRGWGMDGGLHSQLGYGFEEEAVSPVPVFKI